MKGKSIYLILVVGAITITLVMLLLDRKQQRLDRKLIRLPSSDNFISTGEKIDELLLTTNELTIAEKKSFINIYLMSQQQETGMTYDGVKKRRADLYHTILQRRINRAVAKPQEDFSVKPVPK
jgi:hypothetical protein